MKVKPVFLIDVDGVVADFMGHTINALDLPVSKKDIKNFYMEKTPGLEERHKDMIELWNKPEFWITLPLESGAVAGVNKILESGFDVVWCSSPFATCPSWYWARLEWLQYHFPFSSRKNFIAAHRKELVRGAYFLDDKPTNVKKWEQHNNRPSFLMDQPWNRRVDHRRASWINLSFIADPAHG